MRFNETGNPPDHGQQWRRKMSIQVLSGSALKNAIKGAAKKFATYGEFVHQVTYSCLNHVEGFADPCHLNAFYASAPTDVKRRIRIYSTTFGKVAFDSKTMLFTFSKGKKSDLPTALITSPNEYERQIKADNSNAPAAEGEESGEASTPKAPAKPAADAALAIIQNARKQLEALQDKGGFVDPRIMSQFDGMLRIAMGKVPAAKPAPLKLVKAAKSAEPVKIAA
jgi:hypothetical protein